MVMLLVSKHAGSIGIGVAHLSDCLVVGGLFEIDLVDDGVDCASAFLDLLAVAAWALEAWGVGIFAVGRVLLVACFYGCRHVALVD